MPFWSTDFQSDVTLKDPKRAFRFTVSIMGINSQNGGPVLWYATSVTKPSFTIESTKHAFLNHEFKYPSTVKWDPITIKMVDPAGDPDVAATLSAIVEASGYQVPTNASNENLTSMSKAKAAAALGRVLITQIDSNGSPIETWTLWNAFVSKLEYGGELKYGEESLTEYSMELSFDWARVETLAGSSAVALGGTSFYNS
jgi:hypothetical protein